MKKKEMSFDEWLEYGVSQKWCLWPVCHVHDGVPLTVDEEFEFDEGHDPCVHVIRVLESPEQWEEALQHMGSHLPYRMPKDMIPQDIE